MKLETTLAIVLAVVVGYQVADRQPAPVNDLAKITSHAPAYQPQYAPRPQVALAADVTEFEVAANDSPTAEAVKNATNVAAEAAKTAQETAAAEVKEAAAAVVLAQAEAAKASVLASFEDSDTGDCPCGPDCPCRARAYVAPSVAAVSYPVRSADCSGTTIRYASYGCSGASDCGGGYRDEGTYYVGGTYITPASYRQAPQVYRGAFGRYRGTVGGYLDGSGWHPGKFLGTAIRNSRSRWAARRANFACRSCL